MKTYLIFDTETTGFPSNTAARDPKQARVCQLAMLLCREDGTHLAEMSFYIKPDGWKITEGAREVHGITDEICEKHGIDSKIAFQLFDRFVNCAHGVVAHNLDFDTKMMKIECEAHNFMMPYFNEPFCTLKATTNICKLPGKYGKYKWPKLSEALKIICGRDIGNDAHDAMVDTKACRDVFFKLKNPKNDDGADLC